MLITFAKAMLLRKRMNCHRCENNMCHPQNIHKRRQAKICPTIFSLSFMNYTGQHIWHPYFVCYYFVSFVRNVTLFFQKIVCSLSIHLQYKTFTPISKYFIACNDENRSLFRFSLCTYPFNKILKSFWKVCSVNGMSGDNMWSMCIWEVDLQLSSFSSPAPATVCVNVNVFFNGANFEERWFLLHNTSTYTSTYTSTRVEAYIQFSKKKYSHHHTHTATSTSTSTAHCPSKSRFFLSQEKIENHVLVSKGLSARKKSTKPLNEDADKALKKTDLQWWQRRTWQTIKVKAFMLFYRSEVQGEHENNDRITIILLINKQIIYIAI